MKEWYSANRPNRPFHVQEHSQLHVTKKEFSSDISETSGHQPAEVILVAQIDQLRLGKYLRLRSYSSAGKCRMGTVLSKSWVRWVEWTPGGPWLITVWASLSLNSIETVPSCHQ